MGEARTWLGRLEGIRTEDGRRYVSLKVMAGEKRLDVDAFPAEEWIERNLGNWIEVTEEEGRPIRVKRLESCKGIISHRRDTNLGMSYYDCGYCGLNLLSMSDEIRDALSVAEQDRILGAVGDHLRNAHPDEV